VKYVVMLFMMMLSDVDDVMCLVYVLNELNFCHVFIIICMCQP